MDVLRMDISVSYYSSSKSNGHKRSIFWCEVNEGTPEYDEFFGTGEDVLADVRVAIELVLEGSGADCCHRRMLDVTEVTKERAAVHKICETGTMAIDGEKDMGVKRGEWNTFLVDFGFTTQSHEYSGQNKFGELLSMPQLTKIIECFKKPSVQLDNSWKQSDTFVSGANSTSVKGGILDLKHVAGRFFSKMQRGMVGLHQKYRDEMWQE